MEKLTDWPGILRTFKEAMEEQKLINRTRKTPAGNHNLRDLASQLDSTIKYSTISINTTLAVLHLRAMFDGSITEGIPDIPDHLDDVMEIYGASETGANRFWKHKSPVKLRNPLQASVLGTPIVLLMANRLDNMNIKRDFLISVRPSYQYCNFQRLNLTLPASSSSG